MYTEVVKVYIDNIDISGDVKWQCRLVLHGLSGKSEEFIAWTDRNIDNGNITPHSFNIEWEGDRVIWSSSRFIDDEVVSELMALAGSTTTIKEWLNNPEKGVELINYSLTKTS